MIANLFLGRTFDCRAYPNLNAAHAAGMAETDTLWRTILTQLDDDWRAYVHNLEDDNVRQRRYVSDLKTTLVSLRKKEKEFEATTADYTRHINLIKEARQLAEVTKQQAEKANERILNELDVLANSRDEVVHDLEVSKNDIKAARKVGHH